jgi:hypothetical protein
MAQRRRSAPLVQQVLARGEVGEVKGLHEELLAVVQCGEGHQGQLAIRCEEEAGSGAQQRKQRLESELVELLGEDLKGNIPVGQRVPQAQGGGVNGLGGAQVSEADGGVREEHQRQVMQLPGRLGLGRAGPGHERAVLMEMNSTRAPSLGRAAATRSTISAGGGSAVSARRGAERLARLASRASPCSASARSCCW